MRENEGRVDRCVAHSGLDLSTSHLGLGPVAVTASAVGESTIEWNPLSHTAFAHIHPLPLITPHTSFTRCLTLLPSLPLPILDQADGDHHWEITLHVAR